MFSFKTVTGRVVAGLLLWLSGPVGTVWLLWKLRREERASACLFDTYYRQLSDLEDQVREMKR